MEMFLIVSMERSIYVNILSNDKRKDLALPLFHCYATYDSKINITLIV